MTKDLKAIILKEAEEYIYKKLEDIDEKELYAETLYYYTQSLLNIKNVKEGLKND